MVVMSGFDWEKFQAFNQNPHIPSDEEKNWVRNHPQGVGFGSWTPFAMKAYEDTGFELEREVLPQVRIVSRPRKMEYLGDGVAFMRYNVLGQFHSDDWRQMSALEAGIREHAWEFVRFIRDHIPGCKQVQLLFVSPFLGGRGGACIAGEHTLTVQDALNGRRFEDAILTVKQPGLQAEGESVFDFPYRMLLPKGLDGLLVTGRGASYLRRGHNPSVFRARDLMLTLGQVVGEAAALCVKKGCTPRNLDVRILQAALRKQGFC
jgi:hypothetical protein